MDPECERGREEPQGPGFGTPSVRYCPSAGDVLSLFPATYTFVTATVTDPEAHYWDPDLAQFVDGPLETRLFFQVAGVVPDANENGTDDLVDIRNGTSVDLNGNGIPDEAEPEPEPEPEDDDGLPLWLILLILIIILLILLWWWKSRQN